MKKYTYGNVEKTARFLRTVKGYNKAESWDLAMAQWKAYDPECGRDIEWFLDKVLTKAEWEEEQTCFC